MSKGKLASAKTERFDVKDLERSGRVAVKKYFLVIAEVYFVVVTYQMMEAMRNGENVASGFGASMMTLLWTLLLSQYIRRTYRCIPLSDKLDAEQLKYSIEKERFTQESEHIWKSKYWVKLGNWFFPKNMVLRVEQKHFLKKQVLVVWTAVGKKYFVTKCEMPQQSLFPFSALLQEKKYTEQTFFADKKLLKATTDWYKSYAKGHEITELVENKAFLKMGLEKQW